MNINNHWIFDDFYPSANILRQKIDDHFNEVLAIHQPFQARCIWNYWCIPDLYTYLRTEPKNIYPGLHMAFMDFLRRFVARKYGLVILHNPHLNMYVNGCGQNIHNESENGRLSYAFSLTRWKERHFTGGETFIYKLGDEAYNRSFSPNAGWGFYDSIEPVFNRLTIFDNRTPHAVPTVQGTMNPLDASFVLHGHMEEPSNVPFIEGGLAGTNLTASLADLKNPVTAIFDSYGYHGFITVRAHVEPSGITGHANVKHMQLMPLSQKSTTLNACLNEAMAQVLEYVWPASDTASKMVFALSSASLG